MTGLRLLAACLVMAVVVAGGCGRGEMSYAPREQPKHPFTEVKMGMTEDEVIAKLGPPTRRGKDIEYLNDPIKTANKEHILYWDTPQLGKIDVHIAGGRVVARMKKP